MRRRLGSVAENQSPACSNRGAGLQWNLGSSCKIAHALGASDWKSLSIGNDNSTTTNCGHVGLHEDHIRRARRLFREVEADKWKDKYLCSYSLNKENWETGGHELGGQDATPAELVLSQRIKMKGVMRSPRRDCKDGTWVQFLQKHSSSVLAECFLLECPTVKLNPGQIIRFSNNGFK
nr:hypothetical protein Iba_chr10cCG9720 [Ipomoea batatas]